MCHKRIAVFIFNAFLFMSLGFFLPIYAQEITPEPTPEITTEPDLYISSDVDIQPLLSEIPNFGDEPVPEVNPAPGRIQAEGKTFEINDSRFLNITVSSTAEIRTIIESVPETIQIYLERADEEDQSSNILISNLLPGTTYHLYTDDLHNYQEIKSDEEGHVSFEVNLESPHLIFIQTQKSTKFIRYDATGGDCTLIGSWNYSTKTCTLSQNVNETIQIESNNIIFNGNGKTITGSATGNGIYLPNNVSGVTISNIRITNFTYGIYAYQYANNLTVTSSNIYGNRSYGIYLYNPGTPNILNNTISGNLSGGIQAFAVTGGRINDNNVTSNSSRGIIVSYSRDMTVQGNYVSNNSGYGISIEYYAAGNTIKNNNVTGNSGGIYIGGYRVSNNIIENNSITGNTSTGYSGLEYYVNDYQLMTGNSLRGNVMSGNTYNFKLNGSWISLVSQDSAFQIDIQNTNTIEGKPLLYLKSISNQVYDANNFGAFYCISCTNISVKNATLTKNGQGIFFWKPTSGSIENNTLNNMYNGIVVLFPSGFAVSGNSITSSYYYGLHVLGGSGVSINGNTLTGPGYYGLFLESRNNETILANKVSGFTYGGIYLSSSSGNTISGNTSTGNIDPNNNSGHGIVLTSISASNQVTGNTTSGNRGSGIAIFGSNNNAISGNISQNNRGSTGNQLSNGIYIQTGNYNVVSGNILRNNYRGIFISGQYSTSPATNNDVTNNLIIGNDNGALTANYASQTEFWANNFVNNLTQAYAAKLSGIDDQNTFNRALPIGGNYWSNWKTPDANNDGWVDSPYQFQSGHQDDYPRTTPTDNIAPTTAVNLAGDQGANEWFKSNVEVSLSAQDNADGFGLDKTEYSLDGLNWQTYILPISFSNEGINNIYYRSADLVGNVEKVSSQTNQIFYDDFTSFNSASWPQATMLPFYTTSLYQNITPTTHQGRSTLYFYGSGISPNKRRGIRTNQTYALSEGTNFEMTFKPFNSLGNRWGVIELFLVSPSGDQFARMTAWVSSPGSGWFNVQTEAKNQPVYSSPNFQSSYFHTFRIRLEGGKTTFTFIDNNNMERWSQTYNVNLPTVMPTAYIAISQYIDASLPGTSYMLDAHVDSLQAYRTTTEYYKKEVKIDKTNPTISINLSGTMGGNNWYVSDVTAALSASDNNGIDKIEYSFDETSWSQYTQPLIVFEGGIKTLYYRAFDFAGNTTLVESTEIKIDKNPPQTQICLTGSLGSNGWYVSDVEASLSAEDNEGGLGQEATEYSFDDNDWQIYILPLTISQEGETTIYFRSHDLAGNIEQAQQQLIKIDKTVPVITATHTPDSNSEGWNNSDVTVSFSCDDNLSGIEFCSPSVILIGEGASQFVEGTASDKAGNIVALSVTEIYIDKTPPVISVVTPSAGAEYLLGTNVFADWEAIDALSGLDSVFGTVPDGQPIDASSIGEKSFTVSATDRAGNIAEKIITYHIIYGYGGLLFPYKADKEYKAGSAVPLMFQLFDANNQPITTAIARVYLISPDGTEIPGEAAGGSNEDNIFRFSDEHYVFNLKTSGLASGSWQIKIVLDDGISKLTPLLIR